MTPTDTEVGQVCGPDRLLGVGCRGQPSGWLRPRAAGRQCRLAAHSL